MKKTNIKLILGLILLALFILFTLSLTVIDVQPIGPNNSCVAYAGINKAIHNFFGVNMTLYNVTDWAGVIAIFIALGFGILGLIQWIKRKSILKVDSSILLLGVFYVVVFGTYLFFEYCVINYRPVLINGNLESSYPSSTTMLASCILPTAIIQFNRLINNKKSKIIIILSCQIFMLFMVLGRILCGVHWFSDILGGLLFSSAVVLIYDYARQKAQE